MKMYLIGNSHIDPVWLWQCHEGVSEVLATFRSALDRMKDFPEFKFNCACSSYYEWVEKLAPEMFEEIKERVKEGRWCIVGGWYLQPDCNMPDGESFARHGLVAQRYFKEKFGVTAKTGYNVDSFGHNGNLPKILKQSGMENYVFSRPSMDEQGRSELLFEWEADDGSRVLAYRNPSNYNIDLGNHNVKLPEIKKLAEDNGQDLMALYGVGNHGGGPTIELIDAINKLDIGEKVHATTDEYFKAMKNEEHPVIKDELGHHARGCYSVESEIKALHRKAEQNLLAAEKFSIMAKELTGWEYPKKELAEQWRNLLFNQFHDILCGCSIKSGCEDAKRAFGEIINVTDKIMIFAMEKIAWHIDTLRGEELPSFKRIRRVWEHEKLGSPIVIFNPNPRKVRQSITINVVAKKILDSNGNEIDVQFVRGEQLNGPHDKHSTTFIAQIPAMGYEVYRALDCALSSELPEENLETKEFILENDKIKVEFDKATGDICKIYDKSQNSFIIDKPCRAVVLNEEAADTWSHNLKYLGEYEGEFDSPEFKLIQNGKVKKTIKVTTVYKESILTREYTLVTGSDEVIVKTKVDFKGKCKVLKFTFPLTDETVTAKIPYGTITRKGYTGEETCGMWFASGKLCVANDSKYGYDTDNNEMRMTVLRSAVYADHYGQNERDEFCDYMEQGVHEFTYSLFPFKDNADAERKAEELNFGLKYIFGSFHDGNLPEKFEGIKCSNNNVIISAVKKSEDADKNIIRMYEINGNDEDVTINLFEKEISTKLSHNEVKTFDEDGREFNLIEWQI